MSANDLRKYYIRILYKKDRFDKKSWVDYQAPFTAYEPIRDYLHYFAPSCLEGENVYILNGRVIEDLDIKLYPGDEVIVTPVIADPISAIVITGSILGTLGALGATIAGISATTLIGIGAGLTIGAAIYSAVTAPKPGSFGSLAGAGGLDEGSPTYGWDGVTTIQEVNMPVAVIYGEHLAGGNIINSFITSDGDKQSLNVLLALGEGEIESISAIKINNNPLANFNGVSTAERMGTNDQTVIPGFERLNNNYPQNAALLKDSPWTYTTTNSDVQGIEVHVKLPSGLFQQDNRGNIKAWEVTYIVENRVSGTSVWSASPPQTIRRLSRSAVNHIYRLYGFDAHQWDFRVTRTSEDSSLSPTKNGDLFVTNINELQLDDLRYPNTALLGLEFIASEQLSGPIPNITCLVKGRKVRVPKIMNGAAEVAWDNYYYDPTGQQYKLLSDDTVLSWDGSTYVTRYSANPIWCMRDLQINARYGAGGFINANDMDDALILEMSQYCEEKVSDLNGGFQKRFRMDIVIDSATRAPDLFTQLAAVFRGMVFYSEGRIKIKIDRPESAVQTFGMGNMVKDSYSQRWKPKRENYNQIDVSFLDRDKNYKNETVSVIDEASVNAGDGIRKRSMRVFVTQMSYAVRLAQVALNQSKVLNQMVAFQAGIDAVTAQVGDIINISHDVPQIGFSGRVISATTGQITIDQTVTIESGKSYQVQARHVNAAGSEVFYEHTVTNTPGNYNVLTISGSFPEAPVRDDTYVFGELNILKKPYRILSIRRMSAGEVSIMAIEYNASAYDESGAVLPTTNYSVLQSDIPDITDLTLTEEVVKLNDGTIENSINVGFNLPDLVSYQVRRYIKARIYISDNNGQSWLLRGETGSGYFTIIGGIQDGQTYKVGVASVSESQEQNDVNNSPSASISIVGKSAPPSDVTNFSVTFLNNKIAFSWNRVSDVDLKGYEIRKLPFAGASWSLGAVIQSNITETTFIFEFLTAGTFHYGIKAIDTSGNYSQNQATDAIFISSVPDQNIILSQSFDLSKGTIDANLERTWRTAFNADYYKLAISLVTTRKWGTGNWDDTNIYWDKPVSSVQGEYITDTVDLAAVFTVDVLLNIGVENIQSGIMDAFIAFSDTDSAPVNYTFFNAGSYTFRYVRFKLVLRTLDTNYGIHLTQLQAFFDLPDKEQLGNQIDVAGTGATTITLNGFTSVKSIQVSSDGNAYVPKIDQTNAPASFDVQLFRPHNGNETAGKINYIVKGY